MKRILLAGALIVTMGIGAFSVYADSASVNENNQTYGQMHHNGLGRDRFNKDGENFTEEERQEWFENRHTERSEHRDERIQLALEEGWITEEEAAEREAELAERDQFQTNNRYDNSRSYHGGMGRRYRQERSYRCH